jgi:hypothetical protein
MKRSYSATQNGSAFIIILIAIAMFAALSYAVSQGGRSSGGTLTTEQARSAAQELLSNAEAVKQAVQTLRLRGCTETQISLETSDTPAFANPTAPADNSCHVYDIAGGKVNYLPLNPIWLEGTYTDWWFSGESAVQDIGTSSPDLIMMAQDLKPDVCEALNKLLLNQEPTPETIGVHTDPFGGTYVLLANGIGDDVGSIYRGKSSGCFGGGGDEYNFYVVLIAR